MNTGKMAWAKNGYGAAHLGLGANPSSLSLGTALTNRARRTDKTLGLSLGYTMTFHGVRSTRTGPLRTLAWVLFLNKEQQLAPDLLVPENRPQQERGSTKGLQLPQRYP